MKRTLFILLFFSFIGVSQAQTASYTTYTIYCEAITNVNASNNMKDYLFQNYGDRITAYEANMDTKSALITCNVQPIDLLQLYRMNGYAALYVDSDGGRHFLNDDGLQMIRYKDQ